MKAIYKDGGMAWTGGMLAAALLLLVSCSPAAYHVKESAPAGPADLYPRVYFYPRLGQGTEQQARDHYECYNWAVSQTDFDPGRWEAPVERRLTVVPLPPPGHDTATLAIAGAVLGALIGGPSHAGEGALIGAAGGAAVGAASDAARQEAARQMEEAQSSGAVRANRRLEAKAAEFRRAMSACLEGRGYSVR